MILSGPAITFSSCILDQTNKQSQFIPYTIDDLNDDLITTQG